MSATQIVIHSEKGKPVAMQGRKVSDPPQRMAGLPKSWLSFAELRFSLEGGVNGSPP
jgi:hypothetical protein